MGYLHLKDHKTNSLKKLKNNIQSPVLIKAEI